MIEKLERYIREEDGVKISCPPDNVRIILKINELCDAVNELQKNSNCVPMEILDLFEILVEMRNRIIHSFQFTDE